jgi:hypothetical protein
MSNILFFDMFQADIQGGFPFGLSIGQADEIRLVLCPLSNISGGTSHHDFYYS